MDLPSNISKSLKYDLTEMNNLSLKDAVFLKLFEALFRYPSRAYMPGYFYTPPL